MNRMSVLVVLICAASQNLAADEPDTGLRPITEADSVVAVYYEDWGLTSSGSPRVIVVAWPDGTVVWSENRVTGGAPYYRGRIDPRHFKAIADRLEKDGLLDDKSLNQSDFGPDSDFVTVLAKSGKKKLVMKSWHEGFEEAGAFVDDTGVRGLGDKRRVDALRKLPPDYMFFRLVWSETRGRIASLIPAECRATTGRPIKKAGDLSWKESDSSSGK